MEAKPLPPTRAQLYVLHAIRDLTEADGRPPTYRAVAHELDYTGKEVVFRHCAGLQARGWLDPTARPALVLAHEPPPLPEVAVEVTEGGRAYLQEKALG